MNQPTRKLKYYSDKKKQNKSMPVDVDDDYKSQWLSQCQRQRPPSHEMQRQDETKLFVDISPAQLLYTQKHNYHPNERFKYETEKSIDNRGERNERYYSQNKSRKNQTAMFPKQKTLEHLASLKLVFDKIIAEQYSSRTSLEEALRLFNQFRTIILAKKPDAQVILYGSVSFACCLKDEVVIDTDIQVNEILPYNILREVIEIIRNSNLYQDIRLNIDHEPCCIDFLVRETNFRMRVTSNYNRGINCSEIVRLYMKFDIRVLSLLRLFRFFAKICTLDNPDFGTLHPMVFHIMLIHFLQQIQEPIVPCLHEYIYGVDNALMIMSDAHHNDFLSICNDYASTWKTDNKTPVEMLFLQLLSYYISKFDIQQCIVSIQTRMPILKDEKQKFCRTLFCADPVYMNRNLAYTMKANSSFAYFRQTFRKALNYFCQNSNKEQTNNNSIITEVSQSCKSFFTALVSKRTRNVKFTQHDLRQLYEQTFDNRSNLWPEPKVKLPDNNFLPVLDKSVVSEDEFQEEFQNDVDTDSDSIYNDDNEIEINPSVSPDVVIINEETKIDSANELKLKDEDTDDSQYLEEDIIEHPISFEILVENLNENQKRTFRLEYHRQVHEFNRKMREIVNNFKLLPTSESCASSHFDKVIDESHSKTPTENILASAPSTIRPIPQSIQLDQIIDGNILASLESISLNNSRQMAHEFLAEHFGADKGPPLVCTVCYKSNHIKSECLKSSLPNMMGLHEIDRKWFDLLSNVCQKITEECKPTNEDIRKREAILKYLEVEFRKKYPNCHVSAYGSFYNGFGFRQSDLDICVLLDLNKKETAIQVLDNLAQSMKLQKNMLTNVILVRNARVPIIRSMYLQSNIELDVSLNNILPIENTRLIKMYSDIDPRVGELGFVMKTLAKTCNIGDASQGTLSSYAYTIMVIHFLQQIQPPVIPILQQLIDRQSPNVCTTRKCTDCNVYFYADLKKLNQVWNGYGLNKLSSGTLWIEFLRYYTEQFDYKNNVVTIRQYEPLPRLEKGWFRQTIAIEDPFLLTHNLADKLSLKKWAMIRRVLLNAGQLFCLQPTSIDIDIHKSNIQRLQAYLFNKNVLCRQISTRQTQSNISHGDIRKENRKRQSKNKNQQKKAEERKSSMMTDASIDLIGRTFVKTKEKQPKQLTGRHDSRVFFNKSNPSDEQTFH
ncbi:unnamed protein product [Rotaria socialis]|uniref:Uncharacterized protein n=1 Tax=Rotaria socialis TaxID=392032 RepID=A0A818V2R1_9BILA|nr:unnamed protein product [Rotaria socialis]